MTTEQQSRLLAVESRILKLLQAASNPDLMRQELGAKHAAGALRAVASEAQRMAADLMGE